MYNFCLHEGQGFVKGTYSRRHKMLWEYIVFISKHWLPNHETKSLDTGEIKTLLFSVAKLIWHIKSKYPMICILQSRNLTFAKTSICQNKIEHVNYVKKEEMLLMWIS
jgi:hypothetical protein